MAQTATQGNALFNDLAGQYDQERFRKLTETMSFPDYLDRVHNRPQVTYSAYQRLYNMIMAAGTEEFTRYRKTHTRFKFFLDPANGCPIEGLENTLESLVMQIKGAAGYYGTEKRILLLHGPVGSAKSTICRALKRGLERYSETDDGAVYTYTWTGIGDMDVKDTAPCPMNDDPLKLVPLYMRRGIEKKLNDLLWDTTPEAKRAGLNPIRLSGELNPHCDFFMTELLKKYNGDWSKVVGNHIQVRRVVLNEGKRIGIGTFQPKDPKNQDATELTGDVNYRKLGEYGVDSDPRAFSFDGEFEIANRGFLEFIELLKLEKEFLYDLLGVCQERQIKPKKFPQIDVDMVLIGHTNQPEFKRLQQDVTMEALRDRTVRVDVPYLLEESKELKVLRHDYGPGKVKVHVAPHTLEIAAKWGVMTRLVNDKDGGLPLADKVKLYDGKTMPGWTEDKVKELREKQPTEGMDRGVSARYVQNKISNALVSSPGYINPFMVLNELKTGLKNFALIVDENDRQWYEHCIAAAKSDLDEILKKEVQKAIAGDDAAIERLFTNYIDNVCAHCDEEKVLNKYTGDYQEPDERLMRSIEEKADIPEQMADDFRRQIKEFIGGLAIKKQQFTWKSNEQLAKALEAKMFEDSKDTIKLAQLSSGAGVTDPELQEKIDALVTRMERNYGYTKESARDVLIYVSSIFARGDIVKK